MNKFLSATLGMVILMWCGLLAQEDSTTPQVFQSIYNDTSPPLREMKEAPLSPTPWENGIIPLRSKEAQFEDHYQRDPSLQKVMGSNGTGYILQSWDGVSAQGYAPPDNNGDVGPNHYFETTNVRFQIWDKTGTSLLGPLNLGTIWSGFPGPWSSSLNDGDPIVLYDEVADRWFIAQFSLPNYPSSPSYIIIAVSTTGDPTGSYYRYGFTFNYGLPDYPKFGVWPDGYYMSANGFYPSGVIAAVFDRTQMLAGNPATMQFFVRSTSTTWSLLPSDWDGTNTPLAGAPNYFGQMHDNADYGGTDGFDIFEFHVDWATPGNSTFTGPTFISTNPFSQVNSIPQQGTTQLLDAISDRLMNRLEYRNFGTHESMVSCHTIDAGGSRAGMRWYEFRKTSGSWSLYQQGTYAPADGLERWMGSIAINANGDIALGYSASGSTLYPEIRYTGRFSGDTPGVMTIPEETIQVGLGAQTGGLNRWGDYTQMVVDPDGETFWYVNQYQPSNGSFNWRTRIAAMNFGPPCPIDPPINPNPPDEAVDIPLTGNTLTWVNGTGADQVEVWFGEYGNLSMVYDGSPTTSFALTSYEPFSYNTTYGWKVVGKNDSCDVSGPEWAFTTIQDPNLEIDTINVYPQNLSYWTGTCNSSTKTQVSLVDADGSGFAGWMAFDISSIPNNATITSIIFNGYLYDNNYPYWAITPMGSVNPVTGSASAIYTQVSTHYDLPVAYSYNEESGDIPNGWTQRPLETTATADMENALSQDWFAIGVYDWDAGTSYYVNFQGWAETNVPYLRVIYESVVPVELTSFIASVNKSEVTLNWNTATETNNQGFDIERMSESGQFEKIGYVAGFGTTTEPKSYTFNDTKLETGNYTYRLKQVDLDGTYEYSSEVNVEVTLPLEYALEQNYPNPFNPSTTIKYSIPDDGFVKLAVYNMLGEEVANLVNVQQKAGRYEINFNASNLASGVYVYRIEAPNFTSSKKLMLMK